MPGSVRAGSVRVDIRADIAQFQARMKRVEGEMGRMTRVQQRVQRSTQRLNRSFRSQRSTLAGLAQGFAAFASVAGLQSAIRSQAEFAGQLITQAEIIGSTTRELQGLQNAFLLYGTSVDDTQDFLRQLNTRFADAKTGTASYRDAFRLLGFEQADFNRLQNDTLGILDKVRAGLEGLGTEQRIFALDELVGDVGLRVLGALQSGTIGADIEAGLERAVSDQVLDRWYDMGVRIDQVTQQLKALSAEALSLIDFDAATGVLERIVAFARRFTDRALERRQEVLEAQLRGELGAQTEAQRAVLERQLAEIRQSEDAAQTSRGAADPAAFLPPAGAVRIEAAALGRAAAEAYRRQFDALLGTDFPTVPVGLRAEELSGIESFRERLDELRRGPQESLDVQLREGAAVRDAIAGQEQRLELARRELAVFGQQAEVADEIRARFEALDAVREAGLSSASMEAVLYARVLQLARDRIDAEQAVAGQLAAQEAAARRRNDAERIARGSARQVAAAVGDIALNLGRASDLAANLARQLASTVIQTFLRVLIERPLGNFLSGALGVGPGRASGGRVLPGTVYPVGERGPELFRPDVPGTIIPSGQAAAMRSGGGLTFAPRVSIRSVDASGLRAITEGQLLPMMERTAEAVFRRLAARQA